MAARHLRYLLLAALAGCTLAEPPDDTVILAEALPETTTIPAVWATEEATTVETEGSWVASFQDPELQALVDEALANNRDIQAAAARVQAALQTVNIAGAPLLPSVSLGGGTQYSRNSQLSDSYHVSGAALEVTWEVDLWGKLRSGQAAAEALAAATENEAEYARQSIAATVARLWITNIEIAQLIALAQTAIDDYTELVDLTREKEAGGQVSTFDVVQVEGRLKAALSVQNQLQARANEVISALEVLLGRYPSLTLQPTDEFPRMPDALSAGLPLSLLDRRPDVIAARNQVIAAFYNVEVAKLARLPGITLAAAGGRLFDPSLALIDTDPFFFRIGAGLLQPIFEGGALEAQVAEMTAEQAAATAEYGQTVLTAYGEVEALMANEQLLRQGLADWQASYADAEEALRLGNYQYLAGAIDMVSLITVIEFSLGRQLDVIESEAALLRNRISLNLALGESY